MARTELASRNCLLPNALEVRAAGLAPAQSDFSRNPIPSVVRCVHHFGRGKVEQHQDVAGDASDDARHGLK